MISFFRHFWEAIKGLKRNSLTSFVAISSVTITLTLLALFASFMVNVERLTTGVEGNVKISVVLLPDSTDAQEIISNQRGQKTVNPDYHKVYDQIKALPEVTDISFSSKDDQLEDLKATMGPDWDLYDQENPLSDVYVVSTQSPESVAPVADAIRAFSGVEEVAYGGLETERLFKLADGVRLWGGVASLVVLLVSIFFIFNTIRIIILSRTTEIQIMRLVGATASYARGPFLIEGALVGFLGAILPALGIYFAYGLAYQRLNPEFLNQSLSLYPPYPFIYLIMAGLVVVGILIGSIGARLSVRRYLKF